ncbi:MAG: hypothetical protein B7X35_07200 [Halothiobacillus sp. 14-56-357]|nr:MAG: hypothetical protein B7X35_07200 [Halothiobacillus sp. 14-56-357]
MTNITRQIHVPYSAAQMYHLVNDVAAYPEFLPWCDASRVLRVQDNEMDARPCARCSRHAISTIREKKLSSACSMARSSLWMVSGRSTT